MKETYDALRQAYAESGARGYWEKKRQQEAADEPPENPPLETARFYAHLGENDKAIDWLERASAKGPRMTWLLLDPCWHSLRDQSRFQAVLKQIGLVR